MVVVLYRAILPRSSIFLKVIIYADLPDKSSRKKAASSEDNGYENIIRVAVKSDALITSHSFEFQIEKISTTTITARARI